MKNGFIETIQLCFSSTYSPPVLFIFIIIFRLIIPVMESGLVFWRWTYITAAVTLVSHFFPFESDPGTTFCLNTGYNVTLGDKTWLLSQLCEQKINEISTLFKVNEISASKHKSAQYAKVSLFLLGKNKKSQRIYALFKYKLHLIKEFWANILIRTIFCHLKTLFLTSK